MSFPQLRSRRGRPPRDEARDTRRRILDAALERFARQGYAGTPIRQIARDVGIRESGLYSHFESKQAIYDALYAETGPAVVMDVLTTDLAAQDPATAIRELVNRVITAWEGSRARLFLSVAVREGLIGSAVGSISAHPSIKSVQEELSTVFRRWMDTGLMRADILSEHLVWELMAPIVMIRLLYLHADADEDVRREARVLAQRHVDYFILREVRDA
jgi:AcrR family transcriptional regulator